MVQQQMTRGELLERQSGERAAMILRHAVERYEHQRQCAHEWVVRGPATRCTVCRATMVDGRMVLNG